MGNMSVAECSLCLSVCRCLIPKEEVRGRTGTDGKGEERGKTTFGTTTTTLIIAATERGKPPLRNWQRRR